MNSPKIVFLDLETRPLLGYTWGRYETNVLEVYQSWAILSFAYKWLGEKRIHIKALPDYPRYKKDKQNDRDLVRDLWKLLDEAEVVIAQNGDSFDIKKARARFIYHGLKPTSPFKTIDTMKVMRHRFAFDSNKLDDVSKELKIGAKLPHTGWNLWKGCMEGNMKAWALMKRYNVHDIRLLEKLYLRLRPWIENHPNYNLYLGSRMNCPNCGEPTLQKRGTLVQRSYIYIRYQCKNCGRWSKGEALKSLKPVS